MFKSKISESIKSLFVKEETFSCIVFDGKTMSYPHLTQKQIDNINSSADHKDWIVTINETEKTN